MEFSWPQIEFETRRRPGRQEKTVSGAQEGRQGWRWRPGNLDTVQVLQIIYRDQGDMVKREDNGHTAL